MPINPNSKINRGDLNVDLSIQDVSNILTKFPTNLGVGGSEKENTQAMLFKFHNPIPGQIDPEHPFLSGNNKYIALPLPAELPFTDSYNFDDQSTLQSYGTWISNMYSRAQENFDNLFNLDFSGIDLANRKKGLVANSQAAITFQNPNFRQFTLAWDLVAKDEFEAASIYAIVQKFRIAAASSFRNKDGSASASSTSAYLKYPDLVSFIIYPGNNRYPFPASYPCFIESVNYVPVSHEGQIPFFTDSVPVGWKLSIVLKESMYLDKTEIAPGWGEQGF